MKKTKQSAPKNRIFKLNASRARKPRKAQCARKNLFSFIPLANRSRGGTRAEKEKIPRPKAGDGCQIFSK